MNAAHSPYSTLSATLRSKYNEESTLHGMITALKAVEKVIPGATVKDIAEFVHYELEDTIARHQEVKAAIRDLKEKCAELKR